MRDRRHEQIGERAVVDAPQLHPAERIEGARVEARGDEDDLRREALERRHDDPLEGREVGAATRSPQAAGC